MKAVRKRGSVCESKREKNSKQKMFNARGSILIEALVLLATVIATSIAVLLLVQFNVIDVSASESKESVLNADFLPLVQEEGMLLVKDFQLCGLVNPAYECIAPETTFYTGDSVHFRYAVESSTRNGQIILIKKYRLLDETGRAWIEVNEKNTLYVEGAASGAIENVLFKDSFYLGTEVPAGKYTLELSIENPLIDKEVTSLQRFTVKKP